MNLRIFASRNAAEGLAAGAIADPAIDDQRNTWLLLWSAKAYEKNGAVEIPAPAVLASAGKP